MADIPVDDLMAIFAIETRRPEDGEWFRIKELPGLNIPEVSK